MTYVLDFLKRVYCGDVPPETPVSEYRLLCSGELYNSSIQTVNYRKTDAARFLHFEGFEVVVASHEYDDYPQELVLSIPVGQVTEGTDTFSSSFLPDEAVAQDLVALVAVYTRRLITVAGKVRTKWPKGIDGLSPRRFEWPEPVVGSMRESAWAKRLASVLYGGPGGIEIKHHGPAPQGVDPGDLAAFLRCVSELQHAEAYVSSARNYALALELIEERPDSSYQLLVASVEALANEEYKGREPTREMMIERKRRVAERAQEMGLDREQADELAVEACRDEHWVSWKFRRFVGEYVTEDVWDTEDGLFEVLPRLVPGREHFDRAVRNIYSMRSDALHGGKAFPASGLVAGPTIPVAALQEMITGSVKLPPVPWFERIVNSVLRAYVEKHKQG